MSTSVRKSGLTVAKLRSFCSVIPGLPKGYSNANKDVTLQMLANRKKGEECLKTVSNAVENKNVTPDDESIDDSVKEEKRRVSPTEEYRKSLLESKKEMAGFFVTFGQEKKRDNNMKEKESMEKKSCKLKRPSKPG